jgi:hypothetical protein
MGEHGATVWDTGAALLKLSCCLAVRRGRVTGERGMSWYDNNGGQINNGGLAERATAKGYRRRGCRRMVEVRVQYEVGMGSPRAGLGGLRLSIVENRALASGLSCWLPSGCCWDWGTLRLACRRKASRPEQTVIAILGIKEVRWYEDCVHAAAFHLSMKLEAAPAAPGKPQRAWQASATITAVRLSLSAGNAQLC